MRTASVDTAAAPTVVVTRPQRDSTPWQVWLAALSVAALRALPYLATRLAEPPAGFGFAPVPYNPKDWLAYVAFVREAGRRLGPFLANPFTTEPQDGRYLMLFHEIVGRAAGMLRIDPFVALELSRVPALIAFFWVLWRLTGLVFVRRRDRLIACGLVAASGGLEAVGWALVPFVQPSVQHLVMQNVSPLLGWSTFTAAYNPLWVVALTLQLALVMPFLRPAGPRGWQDGVLLGVGLPLLAWTHPYSAVVLLAVAVTRYALAFVTRQPCPRAAVRVTAAALTPAAVVVAGMALWQHGDAVYAHSARAAFGPQAVSAIWYPLGLGALGPLAVLGWRRWLRRPEPATLGLLAWTFAVVMLHQSPLVNGYHFVAYLHVPVCLAATPVVADAWARLRERRSTASVSLAVVVAVLLFQTPVTATVQAVRAATASPVPQDVIDVLATLRREPSGHVLADPVLGGWIPAWTDDRVYVGHWFLTPQYAARSDLARAIVSGAAAPDALRSVVATQRIRYVVAPRSASHALTGALGGRVERSHDVGAFSILTLRTARAGDAD